MSDNIVISPEDQQALNEFVQDNRMFYSPDPDIVFSHKLEPRTQREDEALAKVSDPHLLNLVRGRVAAALLESYNMVEQMGTAPGAKWGDLATGVHTASGDLSDTSSAGVTVFAVVCQYPVKFVNKHWKDEPTVGIRDGDAFLHNDSRYGGVHNTDQSLAMPLFHEGQIVAWVSATVHEGENGACEPGGMPAAALSKWDEGLKMSPFRIVENYKIKRDVLTFLQNSVREPKLQYEDIKVKMFAIMRMMERMRSVIAEFGVDALIAFLRKNLEDTDAEVRRRIKELPDGIVRYNGWVDSTLREPALIKHSCQLRKQGDKATWSFEGCSPQFANRPINTILSSTKAFLLAGILQQIWPDMPRNQAVFSSFDVDPGPHPSNVHCDFDAPMSMSVIGAFSYLVKPGQIMSKFVYGLPLETRARVTPAVGTTYNQPATFIFGGVTQHHELTANFCADINGAGQGGRENRDGPNAMAPMFGVMVDTGEQELMEEEMPMVRLVGQQLAKDRVGWGKYRGGLGYEQIVTHRLSGTWGYMTGSTGSSFPSCYGLFGGYGTNAYPLCRIKGINVFEWLNKPGNRGKFSYDIVSLMNEQPIEDGRYSSSNAGIIFEQADQGELYMICQGTGGGYGDVLERDPELVMQDLREDLISDESAWDIYRVIYDKASRRVDEEATKRARDEERAARIARGRPFKEFVKEWCTSEPPQDIPYFGSWGDDSVIYAGVGKTRIKMTTDAMQVVTLPDPKDVQIAKLEAELAQLKKKS